MNSRLSGVYGNWIRKTPSSGAEKFINDAIERFNEPEYVTFVQHQDFLVFIKQRCEALFKV